PYLLPLLLDEAFLLGDLGAHANEGLPCLVQVLNDGGAKLGVVPQRPCKGQQSRGCGAADEQQRGQRGPAPCPLERTLPGRDGPATARRARQEAAQVGGEGVGGVVTPRRLFRQAFETDRFQVARHGRLKAPRRNGLGLTDLADRLQGVLGAEGWPAGEALVED